MTDKPFTTCENCGQPKMKDEDTEYVIVMFRTKADKDEFVQALNDIKGSGMTAYSLDD